MRDKMENDIFNFSQEPVSMVLTHACTSTDSIIGAGIVISIWTIIFIGVLATDERRLALGAASFVAFIFSIGLFILNCGTEFMIILTLILSVIGLVAGWLAKND